MSRLEKVTCFILRETGSVPELLLIQHLYAGWQFPAGTVEPGESSDQAALREAQEEINGCQPDCSLTSNYAVST